MEEKAALVVPENGLFIGNTFRQTWKIFKEDWISVYAVFILPWILMAIYSFALSVFKADEGSTAYWIIYVAYMILSLVVGMGVTNALMTISRGKKISLETFKSVLPKTVNYIASQILMMLIILGGMILFIIPGFIFSIKYMFTPYLVIDKNMGPIEALKASAKLTDGVKWDLVGFLFTSVLLMYSGILAIFVGLLVTIPVVSLSYLVLYNMLVNRKK
ncbi:hypothetical protein KA111_00020 [Candidatus Woesebacteria bacterium]|nr:hypothetical protein [Candidatus Woesebacteria bacterium]